MRTAVLLGAGASRDAGLPLTNEFAVQLMAEMHKDYAPTSPEMQALNFIYGAMVDNKSERGEDPLAAVNVETMISAIRLLADRENHEVVPFIQAWKPAVTSFPKRPATVQWGIGLKRDLEKALTGRGAFSANSLASTIDAQIDRAIVRRLGDANSADLYMALEHALLVRVRRLLLKPLDVAYLHPLIEFGLQQVGGLDVITLNYDLTVETAVETLGVPVNTGLRDWVPGSDLKFPPLDKSINLIKPHGSVNWRRVDVSANPSARTLGRIETVVSDLFGPEDAPGIVIGDREKLASGGATLALVHAAQEVLSRADRLVVVGYRFADNHINSLVRDWLSSDDRRVLVVLDPGFETGAPSLGYSGVVIRMSAGYAALSFGQELWQVLGALVDAQESTPARMEVIQLGTREGLKEALELAPIAKPSPLFDVQSV